MGALRRAEGCDLVEGDGAPDQSKMVLDSGGNTRYAGGMVCFVDGNAWGPL